MAILTKDQYLQAISAITGDSADDSAIRFMEDMTDTYNEFERRLMDTDAENWQARYEENDAAWRKKFKARFMSGGGGTTVVEVEAHEDEEIIVTPETITVEDLFE